MCKAEVSAPFGAVALLPPSISITIYSGRAQVLHLKLLQLFHVVFGPTTSAQML